MARAHTVRRLLYADIVQAVFFVALAFLALFFFVDMVDEMASVGRNGRTMSQAMLEVSMALPGHLYVLLPIAVLIGSIYAMARLAQSSEFTILRTSGLSPTRALALLAQLGLAFSLLTYLAGDFAAPASEHELALIKARARGSLKAAVGGAWLKDARAAPDGEHRFSVNVGATLGDGTLKDIRIFEFDPQGRLIARTAAERGEVVAAGWLLQQVQRTAWVVATPGNDGHWQGESLATWTWPNRLGERVVQAATLPVESMTAPALWTYLRHLRANDQETRRLEIAFWQRALYPFAALVMMALALPFAYLQARRGGISVKVFGGIMLGISFVLLNNVSSHVGQLQQWTPWFAASLPALIYLLISLGAFAWLVRFR